MRINQTHPGRFGGQAHNLVVTLVNALSMQDKSGRTIYRPIFDLAVSCISLHIHRGLNPFRYSDRETGLVRRPKSRR